MKHMVPKNEDIILEKDDFEYSWWKVICFLFGGDPDKTYYIRIPKDTIEVWEKDANEK